MRLFTIGFTQTRAREFFPRLKAAGVQRLVDVRLNNTSQLARFAKKDDLEYFVREIVGADYVHLPLLAPTQDILDDHKKRKGSWTDYEAAFLGLMAEWRIETVLSPDDLDGGCLLCSEEKPHHRHRRLVAEYLRQRWGDVEVRHLR
jgi:uncharacterized protein (DUF488 family)